ncbi:MAG: hypothetical protein KGQ59_09220 [Bdellovibrionales bacterium]|nr:hypothetical protein [Bdellovibrionales bacterium]
MSDTKANEKNETPINAAGEAASATSRVPLLQASADEVLLKYTRCVHCQSRLHFSYLTDFSRNLTQETARCPECQNQAHQVMHRLQ